MIHPLQALASLGPQRTQAMLGQVPGVFSAGELRSHMEEIFAADLRLKSSAGNPRLIMERLVLGMCLRSRAQASGALGART